MSLVFFDEFELDLMESFLEFFFVLVVDLILRNLNLVIFLFFVEILFVNVDVEVYVNCFMRELDFVVCVEERLDGVILLVCGGVVR